jgi:hypothetical protein
MPAIDEDLATLSFESPWRFGYGWFDEASGHVGAFTPLPHWTGSAWQGGPTLPDSQLGWVLLHASGGHPGEAQHAAIRRWIAPRDGTVSISGQLRHGSDKGDGVRGRIVLGGAGKAGEWVAQNGEAKTPVAQTAVRQGETIDFVVDCRENTGYDGFAWSVEIAFQPTGDEPSVWKSDAGMRGPSSEPPIARQVARAWRLAYGRGAMSEELSLAMSYLGDQVDALSAAGNAEPVRQAITNLCQVLLGSNEFLYVE